MSKGGGGGTQPVQQTKSTVTSTNLPEYARPFFERLMQSAEAEAGRPYLPYGGPRIAGFTPEQEAAFSAVEGAAVRDPLAMGASQDYFSGIMQGADPFEAQGYADIEAMRYDPTTGFQPFMDPYIEQVLDTQRRRETDIMEREAQSLRDRATQVGAFGGSRPALEERRLRSDFGERIGDLEARTRSEAFGQAQQLGADQFERDRASALAARRQGAEEALREAESGVTAAGKAAALDPQIFAQAAQQAEALEGLGLTRQQMTQANLDLARQDFINQRDYEKQMINFLGGVLRGVPVSPQSEVVEYQPPPSFGGQLLGAGVAGAGLLDMMKGKT
jgi:hypothetical protein